MIKDMHWAERLASEVEQVFGKSRDIIVCNGGLSVSGLQHVGRLRGEVTAVDVVARILRKRGYQVKHTIVLYTMDAWKGKTTQLNQFRKPEEAKEYIGRPLYLVPDPYGCHENWVEHYWEDFGNYLDRFAENVEVVTTRDLYSNNSKMHEFVKLTLGELRGKVIKVINKYRGRKPYPESWIPFSPICEKCLRIDKTITVDVDLKNYTAKYICENCGHEGKQDLRDGKLMWRVEWVGVWYSLNVAFEPYGKDHATPGGSRDSCNDLARNAYNIIPPVGAPYEWVGYAENGKDLGDMGSSDFIGFTPKTWLEVAEPEVLRYLYLFTPLMKRIVLNLRHIPRYTNEYDFAERVYYGIEEVKSLDEKIRIVKAFEYAQLKPLPAQMPFQLKYLHAVVLVQTLPEENLLEEAIKKLKQTRMLTREPTDVDLERINRRLQLARNWLQKYAPAIYRIEVLPELTDEVLAKIDRSIIRLIRELYDKLAALEEWNESTIKQVMINIKRTKEEERKFFKALYLAFFGKEYGPRIAPYLALLDREFVLTRLREVVKTYEEK